jgi:glycosyltransferase involved in cell wall biosynthesis
MGPDPSLRILQVSTMDRLGGAEKVAWELFRSYRLRGYGSWLAVGHKLSMDPDVLVIPQLGERAETPHEPASFSFFQEGARAVDLLGSALTGVGRRIDAYCGIEPFRYPGTWQLLKLTPQPPDIVHCHNLHHRYFDLRALPWLSAQVPLILTLHDMWLLTGHCSHSLDCERWKMGCGRCPDLNLYPGIRQDATRYNWRRKRKLYERSQLRVATPSQWLMDKVQQSVLGPAILESRVIPNGVDRSIFRPADKQAVRPSLGIPADVKVLLFAANGIRDNPWKDYKSMRTAIAEVGSRSQDRILFLAVGEDAPSERIGRLEISFIPYQQNPDALARYYQAADVYVHAARVDTFPNTVLEALACGLPVVATEVGGIPEQIKPLRGTGCRNSALSFHSPDQATGIVVPPSDPDGLASAIEALIRDGCLRDQMALNAAADVKERFDLNRQVETYLAWYKELVDSRGTKVKE